MAKSVYQSIFDFSKTRPLHLWVISLLTAVLSMFSFMMGGPVLIIGYSLSILFETAFLMVCYKAVCGRPYLMDDLFAYFKDYKRAFHIIGGSLYAFLFVFLWCLIPIVGPFIAVVKTYEYKLVPFILANEPDVPARDARIVSSFRTKGHKMDMFLADVVWIVLAIVALMILYLLSTIRFIGWIFFIVFILLLVLVIFLSTFVSGLISAEFYKRLKDVFVFHPAKKSPEDLGGLIEAIFDPDTPVTPAKDNPQDIDVEIVEIPAVNNSDEVSAFSSDSSVDDIVNNILVDEYLDEKSAKKPAKKAPAKSAAKKADTKTTAKKAAAKKTATSKTSKKSKSEQ